MTEGTIAMDKLLIRSTDMLANDIGKETVMMSIEMGKYYGMNKTGSYIWKVLETPMSLTDLCNRIVVDFKISKEQCLDEVKPFIEEMVKENILIVQ